MDSVHLRNFSFSQIFWFISMDVFILFREREREPLTFCGKLAILLVVEKPLVKRASQKKKVVVVSVICDCNGKSEVPPSPFVFSGNFQFAVSVD